MKKRKLAVLLCLALLLGGCTDSADNTSKPEAIGIEAAQTADYSTGLCDNIENGAILHAWCWSFDTVRESMCDIAAAGFTAVQTSPANAIVSGGDSGLQLMGKGKWYYQYQPTDWQIGNYMLGDETAFKAMCEEAHKYGVKIIVDVVPNHTTPDLDEVSDKLIEAAGGIDRLYHPEGDKKILLYGDRLQCTSLSLSGLPDVDTENTGFQDYFISYLNALVADGADGFRFDAAKHIALPDDPQAREDEPNTFWPGVTAALGEDIFCYGEVLQGDNDRLGDYIQAIGHTTASTYGENLRSALKREFLKISFVGDMNTDSPNVVTWVESHDTYADGTSQFLTDEQIVRGYAVIAARGEGTPLFFDRPLGAGKDNRWGEQNRIGAAGSPLYKDPTVAAVNRFRTAMAGEATEMTNPDDDWELLLISRGSKGAVIMTAKNEDTAVDIATALPDGEYPDRSGQNGVFAVSGGRLTGTLKAGGTAVLYNERYTEFEKMPLVSAQCEGFARTGEQSVTLNVSGAEKGLYSVNGKNSENGEFTDGEVITLDVEGDTVLKLSAESPSGNVSVMSYYFRAGDGISAGDKIYLQKPEGWGDKLYAYVYDETVTPTEMNFPWPGREMTDEGDMYSYTFERDWANALVIFTDGAN